MNTVDMYRRLAPRSRVAMPTITDNQVLSLWYKGKDTYDIAVILSVPECEIERRLHMAKDALLRDQAWHWPEARP